MIIQIFCNSAKIYKKPLNFGNNSGKLLSQVFASIFQMVNSVFALPLRWLTLFCFTFQMVNSVFNFSFRWLSFFALFLRWLTLFLLYLSDG